MPNIFSISTILLLATTSLLAQASTMLFDINVSPDQNISITAFNSPSNKKTNLLIKIPTHYESGEEFNKSAEFITEGDTDVWSLDLLGSYMMPATKKMLDYIPPEHIVQVVYKASKMGYKNIFLYSTSRASILSIRVEQELINHNMGDLIKGHIFHSPHLWDLWKDRVIINPYAKKSEKPIYLFISELGTKFFHSNKIKNILSSSGSRVFLKNLMNVRVAFHLRGDDSMTKADYDERKNLGKNYSTAINWLLDNQTKNKPPKNHSPHITPEYDDSRLDFKKSRKSSTLKKPLNLIIAKPITKQTYSGINYEGIVPGKVTLLNFWASWCMPCHEEIPSMVNLSKMYPDELDIVTINVGEDTQEIKDFKKLIDFDFIIPMDIDGKTMKDWGVFVYPSNYLIDKKGFIRYFHLGSMDWDAKDIKTIVNKLIKE